MERSEPTRIAIVGGCGHAGLPLALALADRGHEVTAVDVDAERRTAVCAGRMPFLEAGAEPVLERVLAAGRLRVVPPDDSLRGHEVVIVTIGTPVDEYRDPAIDAFDRSIRRVLDGMEAGQLLILRSTVFPGMTGRLWERILAEGPAVELAYCPERIAQGRALEELTELPQLVAGTTPEATRRASHVFGSLGVERIELSPIEAELAKLFANAYRYINFSISNQFYMMARGLGVDFGRVHRAVTANYPRLRGFAGAGLTGGPCLLKDTMQLAALNHNTFVLGHAAMMVNEGLPRYLVDRLKAERDLSRQTVGILGMAFKGNSDDRRDSLAYKLRKILTFECRRVVCTDPHIRDPGFLPLADVLEQADLLILGACHDEYRGLVTRQPLVDVFGFTEPRDA